MAGEYGTPDIANGDTRHTPTGFASLQEVQRQSGFIRPTVHFSRLVRHPRASPNTASRCPLRWDYPDTSVRVAPTGALYKKINGLCAERTEISLNYDGPDLYAVSSPARSPLRYAFNIIRHDIPEVRDSRRA